MLHPYETNKIIDNLNILSAALVKYIPPQLLRHVPNGTILVNSDRQLIQHYLDNSNNQLRMYGPVEELVKDMKTYTHFPLRRKVFPRRMGVSRYTIPDVYFNLKKEVLYCKQDYLFHLQSSVFEELTVEFMPPKLKEYMSKHEDRLSGCYEFVKYDPKIFEKIRKLFKLSANLEFQSMKIPANATVSLEVTHGEVQFFNPEDNDYIKVFDGLISEYPWIFLPNKEAAKPDKMTVVVRVFDDSCEKFVMESELYNAINLKHPNREPLECKDENGFLRTIDVKDVFGKFRDEIDDIELTHWPIQLTRHAAVPIPTPTGDHCVLAADALIEILVRSMHALNVFQKLNRNTCHLLPKFILFLEKYFPSNIGYRYFIKLELIKKINEEHDEFWKRFDDKPVKLIREVGPNGFTLEDLKKELKYLGYHDIFPEIIREACDCYDNSLSREETSKLTTFDLFRRVEQCLFTVIFLRFPSLLEFMYRQKNCIHTRSVPCAFCVTKFKESAAKIETERREKAKRATSEVKRSADDKKCDEMPKEEAKPKPIEIAPASSMGPPASSTDPAPIPVVDRTPRTISTAPILPTIPVAEIRSEQASILEPEPPVSEVKDHKDGCEMDPKSAIRYEPILPSMNPPPPSDIPCQKCDESREEVIETYRKVMNLEKSLKEKDAELEKLRELGIKAKKSEEMETKLKELEKESEELKKKHLKILEENHKMMKGHGNTKQLEDRLKEKEVTLKESEDSIDSMETEIQDLKKVSYSWVSKVAEKDKKIKELEEKLEKAESTSDGSLGQLGNLLGLCRKYNERRADDEKKISELTTLRTKSTEEKDKVIAQLKRDHSKLLDEKTAEVEQLKQAHSKLLAEKTKEWAVEKKNHSKTIEELKKSHSEAIKSKVSKFRDVLKTKISEKDVEVLQTKRINKELTESIRVLKQKVSDLEEKCDADQLEMVMKQSNLEEEIAKLQESKTQQAAEQDKAKETISTIRGLLDTLSPAPLSPEAQQALLSLQKRRDTLRENSPLKLAKELVERLISLSTRPEIHQMAHYEYEQYEGKVAVYMQVLEVSIDKLNDKSSMTTPPIPSQFPSFSDRFIDEYWMEIQKSRTEQRVDNECLICFDEMTPEQKTLECEHCKKVFHLECASQWLKVARTCSHCRQNQLDPNEFPNLQ